MNSWQGQYVKASARGERGGHEIDFTIADFAADLARPHAQCGGGAAGAGQKRLRVQPGSANKAE